MTPKARPTTLCEALLTEDDGSRWLCIRMKHRGHAHQWATDTSVETEAQRVNRIMQTVLTEHLSKLQREATAWT